MSTWSLVRGMSVYSFSSTERLSAIKAQVDRLAAPPRKWEPDVRLPVRTGGQSGAARQATLLMQHSQTRKAGANQIASKTAIPRRTIAPKKDTLGAWYDALEKKLSGLSEQEISLRLDALKNRSKPGDAARLAVIRSEYTRHIKLLDAAIDTGESKLLQYERLQDSGHALNPAQQADVADLDDTVRELRLKRLREPSHGR